MTPTLATILEQVREAARQRQSAPPAELPTPPERRGFRASLSAHDFAIIAEIKRASPSAGAIRPDLSCEDLATQYESGGARAISVLTCPPFFRGSLADLAVVRDATKLPVLCKDFLVSPFQIEEAAAHGADAVLLIAAALSDAELEQLTVQARTLGMEVLHEAHTAEELDRILELAPTMVGINSRNLKTMKVDPQPVLELGRRIPDSAMGVFESGVKSVADLQRAQDAGYRVALIGESLLRAERPEDSLRSLIQDL